MALPEPGGGDLLQLVLRPLLRGYGLILLRVQKRGGCNLVLLKLQLLSDCFWAVIHNPEAMCQKELGSDLTCTKQNENNMTRELESPS